MQGVVVQIKNRILLLQDRHGVPPLQNGKAQTTLLSSGIEDSHAQTPRSALEEPVTRMLWLCVVSGQGP